MPDTLSITTDSTAITGGKRRWIVLVGLSATSLGLVVSLVMLLMQRGQIEELRQDLSATIQSKDDLQGELSGLSQQVAVLQGTGSDSGNSLAALQASLDSLSAKVKAHETRLKTICDEQEIRSMQSNLDGQQSAISNPNWTYFSNLSGVLYAACGPAVYGEYE